MKIFIDESGNFAEGSDWSVICGLAIPHKEIGPITRELKFRSKSWPKEDGEIKGRLLDPIHFQELVEILYRHDALLHANTIHVAGENFDDIDRHKQNQCEGMTKHLGPDHFQSMIDQVWQLRKTLEKMPRQLYLQCVIQSDLIASAFENTVNYFSQRRPRELGRFEWSIDAKDSAKITTQENWWRLTLGPLLESRSIRKPFDIVQDEDFNLSHLNKEYLFVKDQWYPDKPRERVEGYDIKKIVIDAISFDDSRSDILLQAVDVLANHLRRILSGKIIDTQLVRSIGRLQIPRHRQSVQILSLSGSGPEDQLNMPKIKLQLDLMSSTGRDMILPAIRRKDRKEKAMSK